jgi:hypothetical protein
MTLSKRAYEIWDRVATFWYSDKWQMYELEGEVTDLPDSTYEKIVDLFEDNFGWEKGYGSKDKDCYYEALARSCNNDKEVLSRVSADAEKHAARQQINKKVSYDTNKYHRILEINKKIKELQLKKAKLLGK